MACDIGDKFRLKTGPGSGVDEITANEYNIDICRATKILERLHKEFTEQYVPPATPGQSVPTGRTVSSMTVSTNPTFYLRKQPKLSGFISKRNNDATKTTIAEGPPDGQNVNRFYDIFTTMNESHEEYRKAVSAILKGDTTANQITLANYMNNPQIATDFSTPDVFKGLYGLFRVNEILEDKIAEKVNSLQGQPSYNVLSNSLHYEKRKNIKTTLEEIAYRENQIYREKFLNIVLLVVGIFIVSSQLMKDYFSFSGGSGGGGGGGSFGSSGSGFGGIGGWLSTRFGSGSGGIFSRFGGLGLGSSGRSRIGNLFTSSPYTTTQRE
jgi:hypothetical protein